MHFEADSSIPYRLTLSVLLFYTKVHNKSDFTWKSKSEANVWFSGSVCIKESNNWIERPFKTAAEALWLPPAEQREHYSTVTPPLFFNLKTASFWKSVGGAKHQKTSCVKHPHTLFKEQIIYMKRKKKRPVLDRDRQIDLPVLNTHTFCLPDSIHSGLTVEITLCTQTPSFQGNTVFGTIETSNSQRINRIHRRILTMVKKTLGFL